MQETQDIQIREIGQNALEYPKEWQALSDKPQTVFALGNTALLQTRKFVVVGSRTTPITARKTGAEICKELSGAFTIVTGVADGADSSAIEGSLAGGGKIVCLLAGGFSALPQANAKLLEKAVKNGGLLLSPHPYETPVRSFSYEYRNKLLATLGEGTLVLGAGNKSGALITARYTAKQGKPVFALPYAPSVLAGEGCNALIKEGAHLTENATDVFKRFGVCADAVKKEVDLTETEGRVVAVLRLLGEGHIGEISSHLQMPAFKLRATLASLEVKGKVTSLGGNRFSPV